jgi:hypothetical protein
MPTNIAAAPAVAAELAPFTPRVVCSLFACPTCNWPLVGSKFTAHTDANIHEAVFELRCNKCQWQGALLGRDAVQHMIAEWPARSTRDRVTGG